MTRIEPVWGEMRFPRNENSTTLNCGDATFAGIGSIREFLFNSCHLVDASMLKPFVRD